MKPRIKLMLTVAAALGNLLASQSVASSPLKVMGNLAMLEKSPDKGGGNSSYRRVYEDVTQNALILKRSIEKSFSVGHRSHMSHRSHYSHRSHTSAR